MHLCAYHGYIKCATALVKAGADLEAKNEYDYNDLFSTFILIYSNYYRCRDGYTPLRLAIDREQVDFALWLLEKNSVNINCMVLILFSIYFECVILTFLKKIK